MAHHHEQNGRIYVDTAFLNGTHRIPGVTLKHMGFGEFYAETPKGRVDFDRMRGKDFPGQSGRSHEFRGKGADWLLDQMERAGISVRVASKDSDRNADRSALIRLAALLPKGSPERRAILAGCEKLPEGPMRDNCEKKEEGGKKEAASKVIRKVGPANVSKVTKKNGDEYFRVGWSNQSWTFDTEAEALDFAKKQEKAFKAFDDAAKRSVHASRKMAGKGKKELPDALKKHQFKPGEGEGRDADGDGKTNEPKPDFLKGKKAAYKPERGEVEDLRDALVAALGKKGVKAKGSVSSNALMIGNDKYAIHGQFVEGPGLPAKGLRIQRPSRDAWLAEAVSAIVPHHSSKKAALVRLAAALPVGSSERKTLLAMVKAAAPIGSGENGYIAFYKNKRVEVMADTQYEAQQIAAKHFRARKPYDVTVHLAEKGGKQVTHMPMFASKKTASRPLHVIAREIAADWGPKVHFSAKPYLRAMMSLDSINDRYGYDDADMIVRYFLTNARSWRGPVAKQIKAELKRML